MPVSAWINPENHEYYAINHLPPQTDITPSIFVLNRKSTLDNSGVRLLSNFANTPFTPPGGDEVESVTAYYDKKRSQHTETGGDHTSWKTHTHQIMWDALWLKFTQNKLAKAALVATQKTLLIEDNIEHADRHWGVGEDGKGENIFGRMLMGIRSLLHAELDQSQDPIPDINIIELPASHPFSSFKFSIHCQTLQAFMATCVWPVKRTELTPEGDVKIKFHKSLDTYNIERWTQAGDFSLNPTSVKMAYVLQKTDIFKLLNFLLVTEEGFAACLIPTTMTSAEELTDGPTTARTGSSSSILGKLASTGRAFSQRLLHRGGSQMMTTDDTPVVASTTENESARLVTKQEEEEKDDHNDPSSSNMKTSRI